jgi:hypothetical protein
MKEHSRWGAWNPIIILPNVAVDVMNNYVAVSDN